MKDVSRYLDAIDPEKELSPEEHQKYLKKFHKLKTVLQVRVIRCETEGSHSFRLMVLERLQHITARHKEMKKKIPHFSYVPSKMPLESDVACINENQTTYKNLVNDPKARPYYLLKEYARLKGSLLTLYHSLADANPYREVVKNMWDEVRKIHRALPFVEQMKLRKSIPDVTSYGMLVYFCKNNKIKGYVPRTIEGLKSQVAKIAAYVFTHAEAVECDFIYNSSFEEAARKWEVLRNLSEAQGLCFSMDEDSSKRLIQRGSSSQLCTEKFALEDGVLKGSRIYLDRREESGIFDPKWGCLKRGFRKDVAGDIEFVDPVEIFRWDFDREGSMRVIEFGDELRLMERYFVQGYGRLRLAEGTLIDFLLNASLRSSGNFSIKAVLQHPLFKAKKEEFISRAIGLNGWGSVRLLDFSNQGLSDFLDEIDVHTTNPLKILKERGSPNLIIQVAYFATSENGGREIMGKLSALFPEAFQELGPEVITSVLRGGITHGYDLLLLREVVDQYEASGNSLSSFHRAWIETAFGQRPHCEVTAFSGDEQGLIEETAYVVGNPYIHIPPRTRVTPDQYTVNFLCLEEELKASESFNRIASWILAHPGTTIHVWYDGVFLVPDLVKSAQGKVLEKLGLETYENLLFKDVREFGILQEADQLFPQTIPLASRLQLIRALIADQVLEQCKSEYYVSTTLDRQPLSSLELFDRKTVSLLNTWGFVIPGRKGEYDKRDTSFQIWKRKKKFLNSNFDIFVNGSVRRWRRQLEETEQTNEYLFQAMLAGLCFKLRMYRGCDLPYSDRLIPDHSGSAEEKKELFERLSVRKKLKYITSNDLPSITKTIVLRRNLKNLALGEFLKQEAPKKALPAIMSSSTASCSST
jgi:hypothetical protein